MSKDILLICWDFPPNSGIGGRRWGKFAKGLVNLGYKVHVIKSAPQKNNSESSWFKDVKSEKIVTHELEIFWAVKWLHNYSSVFSFMKIRIAQLYLKFFYKGTIYDKAIGCEKELIELAKKIISKNNIKNIIVTGAPFNLLYYTAKLKSEEQNLNIIADYRDPWINSVNYGMNYLNSKRLNDENKKQNFVFEKIDVITAPNNFLIEQIKQSYTGKNNVLPKFKELSHIFDMDDFVKQEIVKKDTDAFKLVYAGALYTDSDKYLNILYTSISELQKAYPTLKIEFDVFTDHKNVVSISENLRDIVNFKKPVGEKFFNIISSYDMVVILLADHNKDFKTTKFFEFLPYKIPYLYVGPFGFVSKSIVEDELGYVINNDEDLVSIYQKHIVNKENLNGFNNIKDFSLETISTKLAENFQ